MLTQDECAAWQRWLTLVVVGLVMAFGDLRVNGFDVLPDVAGRAVILVAAVRMPHAPGVPRLRTVLVAAAVAGVALELARLLGAEPPLLAGLVDDVLVISLLLVAVRLAQRQQLARRRKQLLAVGAAFACFSVGMTLAVLSEVLVLALVLGVLTLLVLAVLVVLLIWLHGDLRRSAVRAAASPTQPTGSLP